MKTIVATDPNQLKIMLTEQHYATIAEYFVTHYLNPSIWGPVNSK